MTEEQSYSCRGRRPMSDALQHVSIHLVRIFGTSKVKHSSFGGVLVHKPRAFLRLWELSRPGEERAPPACSAYHESSHASPPGHFPSLGGTLLLPCVPRRPFCRVSQALARCVIHPTSSRYKYRAAAAQHEHEPTCRGSREAETSKPESAH